MAPGRLNSQTLVSTAWAHFLCPRLPGPRLLLPPPGLLRLGFLLQLSNLSLPPSCPILSAERLSLPSPLHTPKTPPHSGLHTQLSLSDYPSERSLLPGLLCVHPQLLRVLWALFSLYKPIRKGRGCWRSLGQEKGLEQVPPGVGGPPFNSIFSSLNLKGDWVQGGIMRKAQNGAR